MSKPVVTLLLHKGSRVVTRLPVIPIYVSVAGSIEPAPLVIRWLPC